MLAAIYDEAVKGSINVNLVLLVDGRLDAASGARSDSASLVDCYREVACCREKFGNNLATSGTDAAIRNGEAIICGCGEAPFRQCRNILLDSYLQRTYASWIILDAPETYER